MAIMDEGFKFLTSTNNNSVENLMKWLKDAGVTSDADEGTTRKYFADNAPDSHNVTLSQFRSVLFLVAQSQKINEQIIEDRLKSKAPNAPKEMDQERLAAECYFHDLCRTGKTIDKMYEKLSSEGKDSVEAIVQFLQDTTIMDALHAKEDKVKSLLADVRDGKVTRENFRELMFGLGQSSGTDVSLPSRSLSVSDNKAQTELQKCYFTNLCKTANYLDESLDKLLREGRSSITELINFLQETTIMDALDDKKREMLGQPSVSRKQPALLITSPVLASSSSIPSKDKAPAPGIPAPSDTEKSEGFKGSQRSSTSSSRLSGQRPSKQLSGLGQKQPDSGPRLSGQRGEPPQKRR